MAQRKAELPSLLSLAGADGGEVQRDSSLQPGLREGGKTNERPTGQTCWKLGKFLTHLERRGTAAALPAAVGQLCAKLPPPPGAVSPARGFPAAAPSRARRQQSAGAEPGRYPRPNLSEEGGLIQVAEPGTVHGSQAALPPTPKHPFVNSEDEQLPQAPAIPARKHRVPPAPRA